MAGSLPGGFLGEQASHAGVIGLIAVVEEGAVFQLLERIAGRLLGGLVPGEDIALGVGGDDNIAGALHDAGQMALHPPDLFAQPHLLGHIVHEE